MSYETLGSESYNLRIAVRRNKKMDWVFNSVLSYDDEPDTKTKISEKAEYKGELKIEMRSIDIIHKKLFATK